MRLTSRPADTASRPRHLRSLRRATASAAAAAVVVGGLGVAAAQSASARPMAGGVAAADATVTPPPSTPPPSTPPPTEPPPAVAALALAAPARARADEQAPVSVVATDADGGAVSGAAVELQRRSGSGWKPVAELTTDHAGAATASVLVARTAAANALRAVTTATDPQVLSPVATIALLARRAVLSAAVPTRVVDGRAVTLRWTARTGAGSAVDGAPVRVVSRMHGRRTLTRLTTNADGVASLRVRPRWDSRWRAYLPAGEWYTDASVPFSSLDNRPPGPVVRLPAAAPTPRVRLPKQPRMLRIAADPRVTRIPQGVWNQMVGATWHAGCPVGRAGLRLVRVTYWSYDGYPRRGEIVVNRSAAANVAATFADIFKRRLPLRSMYREDRFGWSPRLRGANDYRSMAAGNTSGFNCRSVVNYPAALSPHAYGFAIDINTWENPYRSRTGIVPNTWWQYHSHPLVAWRSTSHPMVQTLFRHGWSWPYGLGDTQHFSAPSSGSRWASAYRQAVKREHRLEHGIALD